MEHSDYINSLFAQLDQKIDAIRADNDIFKEEFARQDKFNKKQKKFNQRVEKELKQHEKELKEHEEKLKNIENYINPRGTARFIQDRLCQKYTKNDQYKEKKRAKILDMNLDENSEWESAGLFFKEMRSNRNNYTHSGPKNPKRTLNQLRDSVEKSNLSKSLKSRLIKEIDDPNTLVDLEDYLSQQNNRK